MTSLLLSAILLFMPGTNLKEEVAEYLKQKLSYYESFEFEIIKAPEKFSSVEIINRGLELKGSIVQLQAKFTVGRQTTTSYISVKLKLYQKVLTAMQPVSRGTELQPSFFKLEKMEVTSLRGTPVTDLTEIKNCRSKSNIKAGGILFQEMIEQLPVIMSGAPVTAHSISGGVDISVEAFARQDGAEGEVIRVITKDKKLYKVIVIDSQNVQILE